LPDYAQVMSGSHSRSGAISLRLRGYQALPDSIVGGIQANDMLGELQDPRRFLVLGYDGSKVRHGVGIYRVRA